MKRPDPTALAAWEPLPEGDEQYSTEFIRSQGLLKLGEDLKRVTIGAGRRIDDSMILGLQSYHRKQIRVIPLEGSDFSAWLSRYLSKNADATATRSASGHILEETTTDAPTVTLVNSICIDAIRSRASDIHIESLSDGVRVRYRIDGVLSTVRRLDPSRFRAVASRIKVMAGLNIMERRKPQDGRTTVKLAGVSLDMRVSCVPTAGASYMEGDESIVMRLFSSTHTPLSLGQLGFDEDILMFLSSLLKRPHGMILVTGPTGSGKSTTLNAMIRSLASETLKIITIEDPVEYLIDGADQIQTNEKIGLGFDALLRRVLRQDPDVILVGEIRDHETARLAVRAALTGHLVLSTLHTNDAVSAVERLRDLGVEPYLIAAVLRGILAQRLVRSLCPQCRRSVPCTPAERKLLRSATAEATHIWEACGCRTCGGLGFSGRFALAEYFVCDPELSTLISSAADSGELRAFLTRRGMCSLHKQSLRAAVSGLTSLAELERAGALSHA